MAFKRPSDVVAGRKVRWSKISRTLDWLSSTMRGWEVARQANRSAENKMTNREADENQ
jgi:hypothetical protein